MKTSNIIVLGIFSLILAWIILTFFITRQKIFSEMEQKRQENKELADSYADVTEVDSFHSIILSGKGELSVDQTGNYSFQTLKVQKSDLLIRNDTMYLNLADNRTRIKVESLRSIEVKGNARILFPDFNADTLSIYTYNSGNVLFSNLEISGLQIFTNDSSSVYLYEVAGKNSGAEFVLKDNSHLIIGTMKGLSINVKKDAEAEYVCR